MQQKQMLEGKFIALNAYIRKEKRSKINYLNFYLGKLEKEEQIKYWVNRRKEILLIKEESVKLKLGNQ